MDSMELGVMPSSKEYKIWYAGGGFAWITHKTCQQHHCFTDDTVDVDEILNWILNHWFGHQNEKEIKKAST